MGKHLQTVAAMACMKTLLMVFNFIFWASGIVILAIGIHMRVSLYQYLQLSSDFSYPYVLIGTGAFIILVSSLACCCTIKGQPVLLYVYGAFLAIIFVLELGTGVSIYAYREQFPQGIDRALNESMANYYSSNSTADAELWDNMQSTLHCCGNHGSNDWLNQSPPTPIPISCCKESTNCEVDDPKQIYTEGCYDKLINFITSNIGAVAGIAIGITFFPLVGVVLSCCLASVVNKAKYEEMA